MGSLASSGLPSVDRLVMVGNYNKTIERFTNDIFAAGACISNVLEASEDRANADPAETLTKIASIVTLQRTGLS